jgi:hypothetical protein
MRHTRSQARGYERIPRRRVAGIDGCRPCGAAGRDVPTVGRRLSLAAITVPAIRSAVTARARADA